jgi:hypothetical protein
VIVKHRAFLTMALDGAAPRFGKTSVGIALESTIDSPRADLHVMAKNGYY